MEKSLHKGLQIKSISTVVEEAKIFIKARKAGTEKSLKLKSKKVNSAFMNGID